MKQLTLKNRKRLLSTRLLWASILNTFIFNAYLLNFAIEHLNLEDIHGYITLVTLVLVMFAFTFFILTLLACISICLTKLVVFIATELNLIALYYMLQYRVVLDKSMMGNIFNTSIEEASSYLSFEIVIGLVALSALLAFIMINVKVEKADRLFSLAISSFVFLIALFIAYVNSSSWLWFDEHGKQLGARVLPWSYIVNGTRYIQLVAKRNVKPIQLPLGTFKDQEKQVVVLVIGETARAANFSQYGYHRTTTPELLKLGTYALPQTESCTTYTTGSLSCLLSHQGESTFSKAFYEPLPTYLHRQGVDVIWRTNNWGEPPLSVTSYENASELKAACKGGDCAYDGVLLTGLSERIKQSQAAKIFIVLHLKGSHGPNYSDRYPERYERFKPACRSVELSKCSYQSLINAYDNTLLYTDSVIASTIKTVQTLKMKSSLLYISDHGESLGEEGLYLHGTPKTLAPSVQYQVPFLIWTSPEFLNYHNAPEGFRHNSNPYSQSNIFHSVLGAFKLQRPVYQIDLDIFADPNPSLR